MKAKLAIAIAALPPIILGILVVALPQGEVISRRLVVTLFGIELFPVGFGPAIFFLPGGWKLKAVAGIIWFANLACLVFLFLGMVVVVL
jgi:hypothetical protein